MRCLHPLWPKPHPKYGTYKRLSMTHPSNFVPSTLNSSCFYLAIKSCLTLCNPMDCSPPGSSVHGIFQARILEWGAIFSSRGSSRPRDRTTSPALQVDSLPLSCGGGCLSMALWYLCSQFLTCISSENDFLCVCVCACVCAHMCLCAVADWANKLYASWRQVLSLVLLWYRSEVPAVTFCQGKNSNEVDQCIWHFLENGL